MEPSIPPLARSSDAGTENGRPSPERPELERALADSGYRALGIENGIATRRHPGSSSRKAASGKASVSTMRSRQRGRPAPREPP
jgi:hypothetical protein